MGNQSLDTQCFQVLVLLYSLSYQSTTKVALVDTLQNKMIFW